MLGHVGVTEDHGVGRREGAPQSREAAGRRPGNVEDANANTLEIELEPRGEEGPDGGGIDISVDCVDGGAE